MCLCLELDSPSAPPFNMLQDCAYSTLLAGTMCRHARNTHPKSWRAPSAQFAQSVTPVISHLLYSRASFSVGDKPAMERSFVQLGWDSSSRAFRRPVSPQEVLNILSPAVVLLSHDPVARSVIPMYLTDWGARVVLLEGPNDLAVDTLITASKRWGTSFPMHVTLLVDERYKHIAKATGSDAALLGVVVSCVCLASGAMRGSRLNPKQLPSEYDAQHRVVHNPITGRSLLKALFHPTASTARHSVHVLVVDDDNLQCNVHIAELNAAGFEHICVANSEDDALAHIQNKPTTTCVFMDIRLGNHVDGCEVAMRMRQEGYAGFIIGVTAEIGAELKRNCTRYGLNGVMRKPLQGELVIGLLQL